VPGTNDSDDLDLDLDEGDESDEDTDGDAGDGTTDGDADGDKTPKKGEEDKRTRQLQSEKDKAEARANKLEKELKRLRGDGGDGKPGDGAPSNRDPERAALLAELRESGLDAVFAENPELKAYGISRDLIGGATRAEMREEASQLVALIKSVETKARNRTLREHGITPAPAGTTAPPPKNYAEMSTEEIEKEISRVKSGGVPGLW
jgi:hypothetical protein